ncbi:MAG TPA: hypothetical protein PK992_09860 [Planctomycetaceae bacterium]|nr:hypothetical protein [Planctomycetaceae bacterium]
MAVKKQPEPEATIAPSLAHDWFQQFLKHLELHFADRSRQLADQAGIDDYRRATVDAVRLTLTDSGMTVQAIIDLIAQVSIDPMGNEEIPWSSELNQRRFHLIDLDIQGTITLAEQLELVRLTQMLRQHVDTETNLPMEGSRKLHQFLRDSGPSESEQ